MKRFGCRQYNLEEPEDEYGDWYENFVHEHDREPNESEVAEMKGYLAMSPARRAQYNAL